MNQTGVRGTGSLRQASRKAEFDWLEVTPWIVSHRRPSSDTPPKIPRMAAMPCHYRHRALTPASPVLHGKEEVATMTHLTRYCAGCGTERLFEQFHAEPGGCPDTPDGDCPEWGCTACGDALIIGVGVTECASADSTSRAALPDRTGSSRVLD
jgi:hypothetical protein